MDDETFDQADLLWAMQQSENAPSTSCPSPQSYLDAYQGEEEDVYVMTLSALLSGSTTARAGQGPAGGGVPGTQRPCV